jgi:hypothetical protein
MVYGLGRGALTGRHVNPNSFPFVASPLSKTSADGRGRLGVRLKGSGFRALTGSDVNRRSLNVGQMEGPVQG